MAVSSIKIRIATGRLIALVATLWLVGFTGASAQIADHVITPSAEQTSGSTGAYVSNDLYSVINVASALDSPPWALVNARGQVAFNYQDPANYRLRVGFLDGERVTDLSPPDNAVSFLHDLNNKGDIAFTARLTDADDMVTAFKPFRWSAARGLTPLASFHPEGETFIGDLNNRGEIVGQSSSTPDDGSYEAARWTSLNRLLRLPGGAGFRATYASGINDSNVVSGNGIDATGTSRVIVWRADGRPTVLGTLGGTSANAVLINNRGDIAGRIDLNASDITAYLWSPGKGVLRAGRNTVAHNLNNAGDLVGRIQRPDNDNRAFLLSRARGLINLHPAQFYASEANDVNDSGVVVGVARRSLAEDGLAYRWSRRDGAVNLNTRLLDPPAGLVVNDAIGISANGDIVANSNAGLLLLRQAGKGTDKPVLGPLQIQPVLVNELASFTLSFRDRNLRDTHTATVDWGDGSGPQPAVVRSSGGVGQVLAQRSFPVWGDYVVSVQVTDSAGKSTTAREVLQVFYEAGPNLVGEGILGPDAPASSASAGGADSASTAPTLFRLAAPLARKNGAATPFMFRLTGQTSFKGELLEQVALDGDTVRLEGTGQLDGKPGYRFIINATAGEGAGAAGASRMAVRIMKPDADTSTQRVAFEAGSGTALTQASSGNVLLKGTLGTLRLTRQAQP